LLPGRRSGVWTPLHPWGLLTGRPFLRSGLEFAAVALGSALAGWGVGSVFEWAFGIAVP
jgi:hypothetical protein